MHEMLAMKINDEIPTDHMYPVCGLLVNMVRVRVLDGDMSVRC